MPEAVGFRSVLFRTPEDEVVFKESQPPACLSDLNLDQLIESVTKDKEEYDLKGFFCRPLQNSDAVMYRQEIVRDLQDEAIIVAVKAFAERMRTMRRHRARGDQLTNQWQKRRWSFDAAKAYCEAVSCLSNDLTAASLKSSGLAELRRYLSAYMSSPHFISLVEDTQHLDADLSAVGYSILINERTLRVQRYEGEDDWTSQIDSLLQRFQDLDLEPAPTSYRFKFPEWPGMSQVEEKVLEFVARLWPDTFKALEGYTLKHSNFIDSTIATFDREMQFYLSYLEYTSRFKDLPLSLPVVITVEKDIYARDAYDLPLATRLHPKRGTIVSNSFYLQNQERIIVITGPNQGGKTTFARSFGQLHYLAALGLPVPAREARLFLFDKLFTHFDREEDLHDLRGSLEDALVRIRDIIVQATTRSIIIMNESFSSTTLEDAIFLSSKVLETIISLDLLCVCVTFIDELAVLSRTIVSMTASVAPDDPETRTYRITRRPPDGIAHALSIATKHRLTFDAIVGRIK